MEISLDIVGTQKLCPWPFAWLFDAQTLASCKYTAAVCDAQFLFPISLYTNCICFELLKSSNPKVFDCIVSLTAKIL